MKAMILAAGLGTRLRPLTNYKPKALVEVDGQPLLDIVIRKLIDSGCKEIIVNVHHFADQVTRFLSQTDYGIRIEVSDERDQLLNTGGGLKHASWFFDKDEPFLLCNTDILSSIDLQKFYQAHKASGALASLATRRRSSSRYLIFNQEQLLCGWTNVKTGEVKMRRHGAEQMQLLAFSGIHAISPAFFDHLPADKAFSIIDVYLKAAATAPIHCYNHDDDLWLDVGKTENLAQATTLLADLSVREIK